MAYDITGLYDARKRCQRRGWLWGHRPLSRLTCVEPPANNGNEYREHYRVFYYSHDGIAVDRQIDLLSGENFMYFTRLGGELISCKDKNSTYYYIQNLRGDVIMLVNSDGSVGSIRDYDATGQIICRASGEESDTDPFGFTGGLNAGNGMWKLGAGFYDSSKSAFIQQDRYMGDPSDPLSLNRYVYCNMDPVNYVDPTGFNAQAITYGLGGVGATIAMLTGVGEIALGATLVAAGTYMLADAIHEAVIKSSSLPMTGKPGSISRKYGKDGEIIQERHYDKNGNPDYDIDYSDHGNPKVHENPHEHKWENGKRGSGEPVNDGDSSGDVSN